MRDNFVNNIDQILIANETQKSKIEFMQRDRVKRDHYLNDLQQNLKLNKQTLRQLNTLGPNINAINKLITEADELSKKLKKYYDDYQNISMMMLMQQQMRLQDKHFYSERIAEFQIKINDLRKYLQDKEDSFSSVIARLKRYEDVYELTLEDKLTTFKKEIGEKHINEFISQILDEKNFYKKLSEEMKNQYYVFSQLRNTLVTKFPEVDKAIKSFQKENNTKINKIVQNGYQQYLYEEEKTKKKSKVEPNRELIRLLKKEKLNNQLLEEALGEAIEKNEELISIKQTLEQSLHQLENKYQLLHAENAIIAIRLGEYDRHFCRVHMHNSTFYEQGDIKGLKRMVQPRLREYAKAVQRFYQNQPKELQNIYISKLKWDVERWSEFICDSNGLKRSIVKKNLLNKSCSVPSLVIGYDKNIDETYDQKMVIEQF